MKILKILFISLLVLVLIVGIALFIFIKTFDVHRFKPQILAAMNQALGRQADFKDIDLQLSLSTGVSLDLKQFGIKDDPAFSSTDLLKIEDISLGIDVLSYFSKKQITVSHIQIERPQLTVIRSKEGNINISTSSSSFPNARLPARQASVGNPNVETGLKSVSTRPPMTNGSPRHEGTKTFGGDNSPQPALNLPDIIIRSIDVHNGTIIYIDQSSNLPMTFEFSKLDVKIRDFSLKDSFAFHAQASLLSADQNVHVEGIGLLTLENQGIQFKNITITTDLSLLSFAKLQSSVPALKGVEMPQQLNGKIKTTIDHLELGAKGLGSLLAQGELSQGSLRFEQLSRSIERQAIEAKFQITESKINITEISMKLGKGSFHATSHLDDYLGKQNFTADMQLDSVDLSEILEQKDQPVKVEGIVQGNFQAKGQGFTEEALRQSLSGGGTLEVKNGRLKDINILKMVLNNISMLPGLAEKMEATLPQNYKDKLTQNDTILNKAVLTTSLQNGAIVIQPAEIEADGFLFSANGTANFDQSYAFAGSFFILPDLSASMVSAVAELQYLLDDQQRIFIPLKIKGKGPKIKVLPDLEYLGKKIFMSKGKSELEKALNKVFEKGKDRSADPNAPAKEKRPEQQIIENILDQILK